ncbi:MAG: hypothetical protein U0930_20815 [Pirellulales bacterium]
MDISGKKPTLGGYILQHVIVFLICVVFPGLTTMIAPATWITFQRNQETISCTTRTCMFFVVPFKVQHVDQVTEISHHERAGETKRQRKYGRDTHKYVHVDGEGFLQIHGSNEQLAEVSVSPASIDSVAAKCQSFIDSNSDSSTTLFAIANWKFGGLMGGVLSSFTLLYVVGYSLGAIKLVLKLIGLKKA